MINVVPDPPAIETQQKRTRELEAELDGIRNADRTVRRIWEQQWWRTVELEFVMTSEHIALLKAMRFTLIEGTDIASVAADGKRPFGNGDWVEDVYRIIGWVREYDADGLTEACYRRAGRIVAELPLALNRIIAEFGELS